MENNENINDAMVMNELKQSENQPISIHEILISMISDKENLTLKTEIHNPKALASLYILSKYYEKIKFPITASIINDFIKIYLEYMVSNKRKSRKEIIKALSSWIEKQYSSLQNSRLVVSSEKAMV